MTEVNRSHVVAGQTGRTTDHPLASKAAPSDRVPAPRRWWSRFGAWLLPSRCALCDAATDDGIELCRPCLGDLRRNDPCCRRCAEPLARNEPLCGRCLKREPAFTSAFAGFRYAWPLDGLITRFKFSGNLAAGRTLALLFAERVRADSVELPTLIVPVPLHIRRLRERGYDQALELGRDIARELGMALSTDLLRRTRATPAQTGLDAKGRRRNVRDAFAIDDRALTRLPDRPSIALLDDVMTTGSTLGECATILRRAGFDTIHAWSIARAPARS